MPYQISIVCCYNVNLVLHDSVDQTVIGIDLVVALEPLEPRVPGYPQGDPVSWAELLQFRHDAVGDDWGRLCIKAVHHGFNEFELFLNRVIDEIGIDKDGVGRS